MEKKYLIQYKINEDTAVINRIKALGSWVQYFEGNWLVKSTLSAKEIYEKLSVDFEDRSIFVIELQSNYWGRMDTSVWDFLKFK